MNAPQIPQIPERVDRWLISWSAWMRVRPSDEMELGYPTRAKPWIGGGESQRYDDHQETEDQDTWAWGCETMNALIQDLPPQQRWAIYHIYGGDEYPDVFRGRYTIYELVEMGANNLLPGMNKRGVL